MPALFISLLMLLLTLSAPAMACDLNRENLLIAKFQGQQDVLVGTIGINYGVVAVRHADFYLQRVEYKGEVMCDNAAHPRSHCGRSIALTEGYLEPLEHVRVVIRHTLYGAQREYVFDRHQAARDVGTKCRPIWAR